MVAAGDGASTVGAGDGASTVAAGDGASAATRDDSEEKRRPMREASRRKTSAAVRDGSPCNCEHGLCRCTTGSLLLPRPVKVQYIRVYLRVFFKCTFQIIIWRASFISFEPPIIFLYVVHPI